MQKSGKEFEKYKIVQKEIEKELNLKEIEEDSKKIVKAYTNNLIQIMFLQ